MARTRDSRGFAGVLKIPSSKLLFCVSIPLGLPLHRVLEKIAIKNSALRSSGSVRINHSFARPLSSSLTPTASLSPARIFCAVLCT